VTEALLPPAPAATPSASLLPGVETDERAARETLRAQIRKLEGELARAMATSRAGEDSGAAASLRRGPRLLSLGELERIRDDLARRVRLLRDKAAARAEREAEKRLLLERMLLDPGSYRWVRITQAELGEPGCGAYHVRPRLGLVGMLAGWWHVKVSSGCPLATGPRRRRGPGA
jgi:hypothetical protein